MDIKTPDIMPLWYEDTIEEPVRELVYLLRNNGFNTECSCGHEMYVQCQYLLEGEIQRLNHLVSSYLFDNGLPTDYEITLKIRVWGGVPVSSLEIDLKPKKGQ